MGSGSDIFAKKRHSPVDIVLAGQWGCYWGINRIAGLKARKGGIIGGRRVRH